MEEGVGVNCFRADEWAACGGLFQTDVPGHPRITSMVVLYTLLAAQETATSIDIADPE